MKKGYYIECFGGSYEDKFSYIVDKKIYLDESVAEKIMSKLIQEQDKEYLIKQMPFDEETREKVELDLCLYIEEHDYNGSYKEMLQDFCKEKNYDFDNVSRWDELQTKIDDIDFEPSYYRIIEVDVE